MAERSVAFAVHILGRRLNILAAIFLRALRIEQIVRWFAAKLDQQSGDSESGGREQER